MFDFLDFFFGYVLMSSFVLLFFLPFVCMIVVVEQQKKKTKKNSVERERTSDEVMKFLRKCFGKVANIFNSYGAREVGAIAWDGILDKSLGKIRISKKK